MRWRSAGIALAVVVLAVVVSAGVVAPAAEAAAGWQATMLAKPGDWRGGLVTGTDGKGNYSGLYYNVGGDGPKMAVWHGGAVVGVAPPAGCLEVSAVGEATSGVIAVAAGYCDGDPNASRPYTYSGGAYHALPLPGGYTSARAEAIDAGGDVLGRAAGPDGDATVVWPAGSTGPSVVLDTLPGQHAVDIDGDSILFHSDAGSYLWQSGTMTALTVPGAWDDADGTAVCGGLVVGYASRGSAFERAATAWPQPTQPETLQAGGDRIASDCNTSGLVAGDLMTWRGSGAAGSLPLPPGYEEGSVGAVGEDDSVVGAVTFYADSGKQYDDPVVWRWG
jgi:hypothetical protein